MLGALRLAFTARLAAAAIAVTLSGATRVAALHAPVEQHLCACRAHAASACDCALCRRAALAAQADDESLPPCHRAAARSALGAERRSASAEPCVEGTCGDGAGDAVVPGVTDPFFSPAPCRVRPALRPEILPSERRGERDRPADPEKPPPRAA